MVHVRYYGPVYHESLLFEERLGNVTAAYHIAIRGVKAIPRYGPLWFDALRLHEKAFPDNLVERRQLVVQSEEMIPSELVWKLYFELGQAEHRANNLHECRSAYSCATLNSPKSLRWKASHPLKFLCFR